MVGVRLGMTREEVESVLRCDDPDTFVWSRPQFISGIRTDGFKLGPQTVEARSGTYEPCDTRPPTYAGNRGAKVLNRPACGAGGRNWTHTAQQWMIATPGIPGEERVLGIWRTQNFADGEWPTVQAVAEAVQQKYDAAMGGAPIRETNGSGAVYLTWQQDSAGRPLPRRCGGIQARTTSSQSWAENCGMTVAVEISPARHNRALASSVYIGVVHQQRLLQAGELMQAAIDRNVQARQAEEVKSAAGAKVKL